MIDRGVASSKGRMKAPANTLFFVFGIFSAAILAIAKGSSLRSRTNFLRKMPRMGTSMAANPARSMDSATASIMPVRIADAHRLCEPSRKVVSTKCTCIERDHRQLDQDEWPDCEIRFIARQAHLRISESKDTSKPLILVWLWFRSPQSGSPQERCALQHRHNSHFLVIVRFLKLKFLHEGAAIMIGTSNSPH